MKSSMSRKPNFPLRGTTEAPPAQNGLLLFPDYEQIMTAGNSGEYQLRFNTAATYAQAAVFLARMRGAP